MSDKAERRCPSCYRFVRAGTECSLTTCPWALSDEPGPVRLAAPLRMRWIF